MTKCASARIAWHAGWHAGDINAGKRDNFRGERELPRFPKYSRIVVSSDRHSNMRADFVYNYENRITSLLENLICKKP